MNVVLSLRYLRTLGTGGYAIARPTGRPQMPRSASVGKCIEELARRGEPTRISVFFALERFAKDVAKRCA